MTIHTNTTLTNHDGDNIQENTDDFKSVINGGIDESRISDDAKLILIPTLFYNQNIPVAAVSTRYLIRKMTKDGIIVNASVHVAKATTFYAYIQNDTTGVLSSALTATSVSYPTYSMDYKDGLYIPYSAGDTISIYMDAQSADAYGVSFYYERIEKYA